MVQEPDTCVVTNGGPLIALPEELLDQWRGTLPPLGVVVPAGWTWGDGEVVCDYDRACDPPETVFAIDDAFAVWPLPVGAGTALVLDGECSTMAFPWRSGLAVVRDVGLASAEELREMVEALASGLLVVGGPRALVWGYFVSTCLLWHATFSLNSFAHWIGRRRFSTPDDSRNNALVAFFTLGEGWHNNHHHDPRRAGHGIAWWEIDPTFCVLRLLARVGLIWDLKDERR